MLYASMPASVIANIITSMLLVAAEWNSIAHSTLFSWFSISVFIIFIRGILLVRYNKTSPGLSDMPRWGLYFTIGSTATGLVLGMAGIFLFPQDDQVYQLLCAFVLVGMASGAVSSLSFSKYTFPLYSSAVYIPLLFSLAREKTTLTTILIPMVILAFAFTLRSARYIYKNTKQNIELRITATEREKELSNAKKRHELHTQNTPLGVIEWDNNFKVTEWNPSAEKIFGYSRQEALGKHAKQLILTGNDFDNADGLWQELITAKGDFQNTRENITKNGHIITCEWYNTPLIHESGLTIGLTSMVHDISERMRVDKLKSEFISTVSHELRTPLTALRGSLGLISGLSSSELSSQGKEMLYIANSNTNRLLLLVNDLLDMQKIESGSIEVNMTPTEIVPVVEQAINDNQTYASQFNVKLVFSESVADAKLNIDRLRFTQALSNLLSNAIKFSPANANVEITVLPVDDKIRIEVKDYGAGIPVEFHDKIYKRFSQSDSSDTKKAGGTGLGLAITKAIVERHQGTIDFITEMGKGTTFFIELPVA